MSKNKKGRVENLKPFTTDRDESLEGKLSFRVTKAVEDEVKSKDNPAEFCRRAIQRALDEDREK